MDLSALRIAFAQRVAGEASSLPQNRSDPFTYCRTYAMVMGGVSHSHLDPMPSDSEMERRLRDMGFIFNSKRRKRLPA